jgi:hypothetical protein
MRKLSRKELVVILGLIFAGLSAVGNLLPTLLALINNSDNTTTTIYPPSSPQPACCIDNKQDDGNNKTTKDDYNHSHHQHHQQRQIIRCPNCKASITVEELHEFVNANPESKRDTIEKEVAMWGLTHYDMAYYVENIVFCPACARISQSDWSRRA